ncbi:acyltransferase family protein [Nocardia pseudobrasiliensis]|nr:acyltransferase family protein [Nocardia pseudobrasiliensis]
MLKAAVARGPRTFRADIEGLRAIAVVAVVLFHAGLGGIAGGFAGVDVFFVISGFLITGMLWREVAGDGTIGLARFYGARARRLLPAAGIVLVSTAVAAAALLPPLQARTVLGDAIASALYVGNYRLASQGTDYLNAGAPPSPFQHYWSLGVEEQFYLVWPALIIVTALIVRRWARRPSPVPYLVVLGVVSALSFALSLQWTRTSPPWAFFGLPTRAWELGIGGMVALSVPLWRKLPAWSSAVIGWAGLGSIVLAYARLGERTPYPGVAALLPVLGAALVIAAGCAAPRFGAGRALSLPTMRAIGRLSYSWYLWHWPVLILAPHFLGHPLGTTGAAGAVLMSGGLAMLTFQLVENPVRFASRLRRSAARSLVFGGAVSTVAGGVAMALLVAVPVPVGHGEAVEALSVRAAPVAPTADPIDDQVAQLTDQVQAAIADAARTSSVPSNLTPSLADAPGDKADVFVNGCVRSWRDLGQPDCVAGDPDSLTDIALVGDSHAAMWNPAFERIATQRHWRLRTMSKVTCPLLDLPITSPYLGREYTECEQWRQLVLDRLRAEHPRLIVMDMSRRYGADFGFSSYDPAWTAALARLVGQLRATGAAVLVLGPIPDPHTTVPTCLSNHIDSALTCAPTRLEAVNDLGIAAESTATESADGRYADLTALFCTATRCPLVNRKDLIYRDDNHLTVTYAETLTPVIDALVDRALNHD